MTERFHIRLLDAADQLLGWAELYAEATPQARPAASCPFYAPGPTQIPIERDGEVSKISVHWVDLDVARVQAILQPERVMAGQTATFTWLEPVWLVAGMRDVPLPAVTVRRPVSVGVPVGALAATSQ